MKQRTWPSAMIAFLLTLLCILPFLFILYRSFMGSTGFTLRSYYDVFLGQTAYLYRFWKSLALMFSIALVQVIVSVLAGFGFAKYKFFGKNVFFFALMVLMILPLQVTLVPNYLMLDKMRLLNTSWALALPAMFVPLGTFIMTQSCRSVSGEIVEAARLDGCGTLGTLCRVVAPMNKSGLVCVLFLSFLDSWNMVEQPLTYLEDFDQYPLSVGLASAPVGDSTVQLVACILAALPPLFLFAFFSRELVEGIALGGEK